MPKLSKHWEEKYIQLLKSKEIPIAEYTYKERLFMAACEGALVMDDEYWNSKIELGQLVKEVSNFDIFPGDRKAAFLEKAEIYHVNRNEYLDAVNAIIKNP